MIRSISVAIVAMSVVLLAGCDDELPTTYGYRTGYDGQSVNGTAVFSQLLRHAGHKVRTVTYLSPEQKDETDVFVWFAHSAAPPSQETCDWFDEWLQDAPNRSLIYVHRDFDAAILYWQAMLKDAPADKKQVIEDQLDRAKLVSSIRRSGLDKTEECAWFDFVTEDKPLAVAKLRGPSRWIDDVDPAHAQLELHGRIEPKFPVTALVRGDGEMLVGRHHFRRRIWERDEYSNLYVVANGSFLLNLPLVNHEHRKLASALIADLGASRRVAFVETQGQPRIYQHNPTAANARSSLAILSIEPFDKILLHLCLVGLIFMVARWPIFGRPAPETPPQASDFGKHIAALGKLLMRQGDRQAAEARVAQFVDRGPQHARKRRLTTVTSETTQPE